MKRLLSIILCIVFVLGLASCQRDDTEESPASAETVGSFDTVEDFKIAIKKNPTHYVDKQVSVKGYVDKLGSSTYTWLVDAHTEKNELTDDSIARISVYITDDLLLTVVGDGDFIEISGTVTVSNGEIYLDNCTYTMITTYEERK